MVNDFELIYSLLNISGYGRKKVLNYIFDCGFDLSHCVDSLDTLLDENQYKVFEANLVKAREVQEECSKKNISIITVFDDKFPKKLYNSKDPCILLYYYGDISLLSSKSIAVIGTREPHNSFLDRSEDIIKGIAEKGFVIVSGLAIGCDAYAHTKCMEYNGKTIAVLPSSIDDIQPKQNIDIARKIALSGSLLISEYPPKTILTKYNYPERDRIQSMLSNKVFVIEASEKSGTMICVKRSLEDKKPVYTLVGNQLSLVPNTIDENNMEKLLR